MKILLSGAWYPIAILRYFYLAFAARDDVEVVTMGPTSGARIPWGPQYNFPKYAFTPDIPTPFAKGMPMGFWDNGLGWDADLVIQVDADFHFLPYDHVPNVLIATDPHFADYTVQRQFATYFFNMQESYLEPGDIPLPYAYCAYTHYPEELQPEYDVVVNGLQYPQRRIVAGVLQDKGREVHEKLGDIWDEYRQAVCKARCVFTHSSKDDLIARVFETLAMRRPLVCNAVSCLRRHFTDTVHLLAFPSDDLRAAVYMVEEVLEHPDEAEEMAERGWKKVQGETYDARVEQILEVVGA